MDEIIKKYKAGTLSRDVDESGAGGFWDYAGDIAGTYRDRIMTDAEVEDLQETIYNELLEVYENSK